jgi:hypothetical protein
MRRRNFLKLTGLAVVVPTSVLGAVKSTPPKTVDWLALQSPAKPRGIYNPQFRTVIFEDFEEENRKAMDEDFVVTLPPRKAFCKADKAFVALLKQRIRPK